MPQGSVLGPVLCLLYTGEINRIIDQYNLQSQCYADDCQVHSSCKPDKKDELIKSTLKYIEGLFLWMASNRLKLNPDKTEFMLMRQWVLKHTGNVVRTCFFQLRRQLKTIRNCIQLDTAKTLVNAFVVMRLDYCNSLLAGIIPSCQLNGLQSVFNAATRLVCRASRYDHIMPCSVMSFTGFVAESESLSSYVWRCSNLSTT